MWLLLAKNLLGVSEELQIMHTNNLPRYEKKHFKITSSSGAPIMVKMEFEINEYLLVFFILSKYLMRCSEAGVQLVLTCLCSAIVLSS